MFSTYKFLRGVSNPVLNSFPNKMKTISLILDSLILVKNNLML